MADNWYTAPRLISPLTCDLVSKPSHLPLLASYIDAPEVHRQYISTPELRGGPFVGYEADPAVVAAFSASTERRCAGALHTAGAIESIYSQLLHKAKGASIGSLYHEVGVFPRRPARGRRPAGNLAQDLASRCVLAVGRAARHAPQVLDQA